MSDEGCCAAATGVHSIALLGSVNFSDLPEELSMSGQTRKAHRLIKEMFDLVCRLQLQVQELASNHPCPKCGESESH